MYTHVDVTHSSVPLSATTQRIQLGEASGKAYAKGITVGLFADLVNVTGYGGLRYG